MILKEVDWTWKATNKEVFLPLSHPPGEARVDFGLAQVTIAGKTEKVAFFVMTLLYQLADSQAVHRVGRDLALTATAFAPYSG